MLYPARPGTRFDHDHYTGTHLRLVWDCFGPHIRSRLVTRINAAGGGGAPGHHAIASIVLADPAAMDAAMAQAEPVLADIPKFTDTTPQMQIGETF